MASAKRTLIIVDREKFTLKLYRRPLLRSEYRLKEYYNVAVGAIGFDTPKGIYAIRHKAKCPDWLIPDSDWAKTSGLIPGTVVEGCTENNPLKERWLGITDPKEGVGIHGTGDLKSIGTRASHGCVRMRPEDILDLYPQVPKGTPIIIY